MSFIQEAYDPEMATAMPVNPAANMTAFPAEMPGMMMPQDGMAGGQRHFANPRGMRGRGRGGRGRGGMGGGSYYQNRQNTMLVVENIPPEYCEISKINDYFKKFGSLTNITVQAHLSKAVLQYSTNAEANAAYNSPDPIFGNRFVKVYWHKPESSEEKPAAAAADAQTTAPKPEAGQKRSEPDPEEVAARAAELAKQREEKQKKHQERMKAILEIQKQKEQLLQQQIQEQKRLMDKFANSKNMSQQEKEELLKSLRQIASDIDASKSGTSPSQTQQQAATTAGGEGSEDLKAKLAKLEAEVSHSFRFAMMYRKRSYLTILIMYRRRLSVSILTT